MEKPSGTDVLRATLGGVVAAMAMTGMRQVETGLGLVGQVPPEAIITQRAPSLLARVPPERHRVVFELAHWGYGAGAGLVFGLAPARWQRRPLLGPLYGLATWAVFEVGIAPALGLQQAHRSRPVERTIFLADHLLFGLVVAHGRRPPVEEQWRGPGERTRG